MSLWIKICGNTSLHDAKLAAELGADAVGFVYAPSPRRVTVEQAAEIVRNLPSTVEKIGVFVDTTAEEISETVAACGLTGVQLHFDSDAELSRRLRQRFGPSFRILRVVHFGADAETNAHGVVLDPNVDAVLVDSRTDAAVGGTGKTFDWDAAREALFGNAKEKKLIAAGGLNAENVARAIEVLHPWGVDVVSGVEIAPGHKDPAKLRAFIDNARAARRR